MSITPILIRNVTKNYKDITLQYPSITITKRVTLIVGENGCGKSTLLKAIMGYIHYNGDISTTGSLAYVPEFPTFPYDITVDTFLRTLHGNYDESILTTFHLNDKQHVKTQHLSKGMKGKLNVIQALLYDADVYVLDEPLSGLDQEGLQLVIKWIRNSRKMVVITTHQKAIFTDIYDEVIPLD